MKLLVTGGLGFIGSNFILHILNNFPSYKIVNVDAELVGSNLKNLEEIKNSDNYKFVKENILEADLMKKLIKNSDVIINFAAESHVDRSISNAKPFIESNILGVFNILEILKNTNKKLIHISTDEVFGSIESGSADNDSRFNPSSPYSSSKASAELLINSYVTTYGVNATITRCTNNYGPRQYPEKLIPKSIILAEQNKKIPIYGDGKSIRDWIFVEDHCTAIIKVILDGKFGKVYNISANNEIDNITMVKKILSIMNKPFDLIEFVEKRPGEDYRYSINSSRFRTELKWSPKTEFEEGIRKTVDWYLMNKPWWKNFDMNKFREIPWN